MNATDFLSSVFGLLPSWKITNFEFNKSKDEINIIVEIENSHKLYPCPICGEPSMLSDNIKEFSFNHLNIFQYKCLVSIMAPNIHCKTHGINRVNFEWGNENSLYKLPLREWKQA